jgi:NTE family protein
MKLSLPWWAVEPRLGVVLGGGATLGAFEVGVIDVMARNGIVPRFIVGTSVGAINAAFWALDPTPDAGARLLEFWLAADRSTMFPDGPVPMVGRLFQRRDHLTTESGLERALRGALDPTAQIETAAVPLALTATDAATGQPAVLRSGPLLPAVLASAAIPGLWPAVEIDGRRLVDGGLVSNCDVQTAVEAGMTDILVVDVMGPSAPNGTLDVGQVIERATAIMARRQTDLAIHAFGRGTRIAVLRPRFAYRPRFGDFGRTQQLFDAGRIAMEAFMEQRLGPGLSVRPGLFEVSTGRSVAQPEPALVIEGRAT